MTDADFKAAGYGWIDDRFKGVPCTGGWQSPVIGVESGDVLYYITAWKWDWNEYQPQHVHGITYEFEMWIRPRKDGWCIKLEMGWTHNMTIAEVEDVLATIWSAVAGRIDLRPAREKDE
jgi:hypothetical protein